MSSETNSDTVNETTAQIATHVDALDLTTNQLIGLFGGGDAPRAMLRAADGTIVMAVAGDQTPMGEVMAIAETYVMLRTGSKIRRLVM